MNKETFIFLLLLVALYSGVFHETAHGLVAMAYGNKWIGIYIGFPVSYAVLVGTEETLRQPLIGLSGGLTDFFLFLGLFLWAKRPQIQIGINAKVLLLFLAIFRLIYGFTEMFEVILR